VLGFKLNGMDVSVDAPAEAPLLFVLNNDLDQYDAKFGWWRSIAAIRDSLT
jgi:hypothetical protein